MTLENLKQELLDLEKAYKKQSRLLKIAIGDKILEEYNASQESDIDYKIESISDLLGDIRAIRYGDKRLTCKEIYYLHLAHYQAIGKKPLSMVKLGTKLTNLGYKSFTTKIEGKAFRCYYFDNLIDRESNIEF